MHHFPYLMILIAAMMAPLGRAVVPGAAAPSDLPFSPDIVRLSPNTFISAVVKDKWYLFKLN